MKKNKLQGQFFEELRKIPIVQVACEKTGISRNSVYRWKKEDSQFSEEMDKAITEGVDFINDMSESQLFTMIKEKDYRAVSFWLRHRNDNYKQKVEISGAVKTINELPPEKEKLFRKALDLAGVKIDEEDK